MTRSSTLRSTGLLALALAFAAPAATPAFADGRWQHHGGWGGGHDRHDWHGGDGGIGVGGVLLGLGVGAAVGAAIVGSGPVYAPPPPVYYAPPPVYYAPPPAVYYGY